MATDPLLNKEFDRRYIVVRKLGSGGMADVYLAEDKELGRRVALKLLNERHANDDQFVERLQSYLDLVAALREKVPQIDYVDLRFGERVYVRPQKRSGGG